MASPSPTPQGGKGTFFNLQNMRQQGKLSPFFGSPTQRSIFTNWRTLKEQPLTSENLVALFANDIPVIRQEAFINQEELDKMLAIVEKHEFGTYDTEFTWPCVGTIGITQYDHMSDPQGYFEKVTRAGSLHEKWRSEAGVDVIERIIETIQETSGLLVRRAKEGEQEYFAGILRAVDHGINVHADYAPYEATHWSIENVVSQITWNILLNEVPGGDTLIYDRQWHAPGDDEMWRKTFPRDSYQPQMLEGHTFKAMRAKAGDLTMFNSRNFHEVKACDTSREHPIPVIRFTISSFIGFIPANDVDPATLVLWS